MPVPILPNTFSAGTDAKATEVDENFDELVRVLDPAGAGLDGDNFATGTPGTIWVCNASGVPTLVSISGDATVNSSGALTVSDNAIESRKLDMDYAVTQLGIDTTVLLTFPGTSLITVTPAAGTYLFIATVSLAGGGGGTWEANRQIAAIALDVGAAVNVAATEGTLGNETTDFVSMTIATVAAVDGAEDVVLRGFVTNLGTAKADYTQIVRLRIA